MKRSEAITLIRQWAERTAPHYNEHSANELLDLFENAGMEPPEHENTDKCDCGCIRKSSWEEETES